jgi:type I restriction-modification system DNA methylase subunit
MLYHLAENGTMGVVLAHGVLFRGGAEGHIRKFLIENKNYFKKSIADRQVTQTFDGTMLFIHMWHM